MLQGNNCWWNSYLTFENIQHNNIKWDSLLSSEWQVGFMVISKWGEKRPLRNLNLLKNRFLTCVRNDSSVILLGISTELGDENSKNTGHAELVSASQSKKGFFIPIAFGTFRMTFYAYCHFEMRRETTIEKSQSHEKTDFSRSFEMTNGDIIP